MDDAIKGIGNVGGIGPVKGPHHIEGAKAEKAEESSSREIKDKVTLKSPALKDNERILTERNRATALTNSKEIFDTAKQMIKGAESLIQVEIYDFTRKDLADLLCSEAKKGVKVQVVLDPGEGVNDTHAAEKKETIKQLKAAGVEVVKFPVDEGKRQIDHVKLLIIDGKSVMLGGMNWSEHSEKNIDGNVKIDGPAANYFEKVFADDWKLSGGKSFEAPPAARKLDGDVHAAGVISDIDHNSYKQAVLDNINSAKKSIKAEMFILTEYDVTDALVAASKRGVDVKVIVDPNRFLDGTLLNEKAVNKLREAGVAVRWFNVDFGNRQKLHSKWATFDDKNTIVGSCNWSFKGFYTNHETGVEVISPQINTEFQDVFDHHWKNNATQEVPVPGKESGTKKLPPDEFIIT
ncbi:MAG: phosphatidylserine/phosphatidylglycerophosphate/cardiolipin synthase family protein [Chloroflexi bacterium]|nr:phosphatidylserine/phosphatidylglycerophosphate/cardiolipin synthase family protein [Chloroflexota bacterium]